MSTLEEEFTVPADRSHVDVEAFENLGGDGIPDNLIT